MTTYALSPRVSSKNDGTADKDKVAIFVSIETSEWKKLTSVNDVHVPPPLYKLCVFGGITDKDRTTAICR